MQLKVAQHLAHPYDPEYQHLRANAALVAEARRGNDAAMAHLRRRHSAAVQVLSDVAAPEIVRVGWTTSPTRW